MSPPDDRRYTAEHVWVMPDGDELLLGVTEHAQEALGDINEIVLPAAGERLIADTCCGNLESVKTVSDVNAPLAATVIERNPLIDEDPELVNSQPYGDGWLLRLGDFDAGDYDKLLDAEAYAALIED